MLTEGEGYTPSVRVGVATFSDSKLIELRRIRAHLTVCSWYAQAVYIRGLNLPQLRYKMGR